jgi:uncharacterized protein with HEPN domain
MKRDDTVYLRHILDAIVRVQAYLAGVSYDQFRQNHLLQEVNLPIVWDTAQNDLPPLRQQIERLLESA